MWRRACGFVAVLALAGCGSGSSSSASSCTSSGLEVFAPVCPTGTTVKGVDVSTYQGTVDWTKAKAAGIDFGFARISDGTTYLDNQFSANWKGMKAAGVVRGAYQYWRASQDPTAQADVIATALQNAGGMLSDDLPIVMDLETTDGASTSTIEANMQTWLAAVEQKTGKKPLIYAGPGTYPVPNAMFASYGLWVANWGVSCPSLPTGWTSWVFWQTSDNGSISGISGAVDTDVFNGSLAELQTYAGGSSGGSGSGSGSDAGSGDAGSSGSSSGGAVDDGGADAGASMGAGGSSSGASSSGSSGGSPCTP